jgi:hypothetical protein
MDQIKNIDTNIKNIKTDNGFINYLNDEKFDWYERQISIIQDKIFDYIKSGLKKLSELVFISDIPIITTNFMKSQINRNGVRYLLKLNSENKIITKDKILIYFVGKLSIALDNSFTFALIKVKNEDIKKKIKNLQAGYNIGNFLKHIESVIKEYYQKIIKKKQLYIDDLKLIKKNIIINPLKDNTDTVRNRIIDNKKYYIKRPSYTIRDYYARIDSKSVLVQTLSVLKNFCYIVNYYNNGYNIRKEPLMIIMDGYMPIHRVVDNIQFDAFTAALFHEELLKLAEIDSLQNAGLFDKVKTAKDELDKMKNKKEKKEVISKYTDIKYLKQLIDKCDKDIITIPIAIYFSNKIIKGQYAGHYNILIINKLRKEVEYYEPQYDIEFYRRETAIDAIKVYLHDLGLNEYKLVTSKKMSLFFGKLGVQSFTDDFNCAAWSYYYFFLRSIYPNKPSQVIELKTKAVKNPYFDYNNKDMKELKKRNPNLYYYYKYIILSNSELERRILNFIYWFNKLDKKIGKQLKEENKEKLIEIIDSAFFEFTQFGGKY